MRNRLKEIILCTLIDLAVVGATGTTLAGIVTDKPGLMYGGLAGTAATTFIGGCYHDATGQRRGYLNS